MTFSWFTSRFEGPRPCQVAAPSEAVGAPHIPVFGGQIADMLQVRDDGIYIDATFGAGGYSREILAAAKCRVIATDRDPTAVAKGSAMVEASQGRLQIVEERFSRLDEVARDCGVEAVDGVVLDIGVSSMQFDQAARGFSFRYDGPLDMRMSGEGISAADVVATASGPDIARIVAVLGEEKFARPIAKAIVKARETAPIRTTQDLVTVISGVVHARFGEIHPATRTFQALRIFVNDELRELACALIAAERILAPQGRLVVVSFHSLEDRIVKNFLVEASSRGGGSRHLPEQVRAAQTFEVLTKRPLTPDEREIARNPRARSAKLRAAARTGAPAQQHDVDSWLPRLPSLDAVIGGR